MPPYPLAKKNIDKTFGLAIAKHREQACLTQYELADVLTDTSGYPWYQATITKIENGARPIRLNEAYALAFIFRTTVDQLTNAHYPQEDADKLSRIMELTRLETEIRKRKRTLDG